MEENFNNIKRNKQPTRFSKIYKLKLNFKNDILRTGSDPLALLFRLTRLGDIVESNTNVSRLPGLKEIDPYNFYLSWSIVLKTRVSKKEIESIFRSVNEHDNIIIEEFDEDYLSYSTESMMENKIGEVLVEKGLVTEEEIKNALGVQKKLGQILIDKGIVLPNKIESIIEQQNQVRKFREMNMVRVDAGKLDNLLNLLGELLINQTKIAQLTTNKDNIDFNELSVSADTLNKISKDLEEQILKVRLVETKSTFLQLYPLIREISNQVNKKVQLKLYGKDVELDKAIIERLFTPLSYIIKNCILQGIETPDERTSCRKDEYGLIELASYSDSKNVIIEIRDDGRGLNKNEILRQAREKKILSEEQHLNDEEIFKLVLNPRLYSDDIETIEMCDVANIITNLKGSIEILTEEREGTTYRIRLPQSLTVVNGFAVRIGEDIFVAPLSSVIESYEINKEDININGEYLPLLRLHEIFNINTNNNENNKANTIIIYGAKMKACLLVDEILGDRQAIIEKLYDHVQVFEGLIGATKLEDGKVAMILDIPALIKMTSKK